MYNLAIVGPYKMTTQPHALGLFSATFLVVGNLVGSGVFMLPASLAVFGSISILSWLFTAAGSTMIALIFAKFSTKFNKTGGPHVFIQQAFGPTSAFFVAWGYWILTWIGNAAIVIVMYGYLNDLTRGALSTESLLLIGVAMLLSVTFLNMRGLKEASFVQNIITALKVLPLVIVPLATLSIFDTSKLLPLVNPTMSTLEAFNGAAILTLWSFVGIESATVPAEQVYNAKFTIPRATVYGTLIASVVYIIGCLALFGGIDSGELSGSTAPFALAADKVLGGTFWGDLISAAAVLCCIGSLNGWMLVVGQIPFGASQQGFFPKFFAHQSSRGVPTYSIAVSSLCMILILCLTFDNDLRNQFDIVAELATTTILLLFVIMLAAYAKLQIQKVWTGKLDLLLLILGSLYTIWTLYSAGLKMVILSTIIVLSGMPMYYCMRSKILDLK
jgi:basic amino acid/polyamine antiporter, APA family